MKDMATFMSMGSTIVGIFLIAYLIGKRTGHMGAAILIGGACCLIFIIDLIRRASK